ncbi:nucleotidyltransferase domain-containing protein [Streptomyces sp. SCSIO ZS0520]|uniref:nucleotidyltransferase domain-containing protein n=1 Tax=Streptomyces sp. SCSIO ZS0520 TaxID=2892996 RepID=UPI0021D7ED4E|nr:nucleotidyltransferase domain-containing protein [Streptomyces sp. SCSIO ZS0520]
MPDVSTSLLLDHFVTALRTGVRPVAVWAHGSLAGGDYQEGRSDLDLIAVLDGPVTQDLRGHLRRLHRDLRATHPLAARLHCGYLDRGRLTDADLPHPAWAHERLMDRPVTPVTRRELHAFGRVFQGPGPVDLLPPVDAAELRDFLVRDQRDYWRPAVDRAELWRRDIWVDLGLLTHARAAVALREGRLITKGEALTVLAGAGAPAEVVADIRERRYGKAELHESRGEGAGGARKDEAHEGWLGRRAALTRDHLAPAIDALVAAYR